MRGKFNISDLSVDIDVPDRLALFYQNSGTGKSFLFSIIPGLYPDMRIIVINNLTLSLAEAAVRSANADLVILDNADLYLTNELLDLIRSVDIPIWVSLKQSFAYNLTSFVSYGIEYCPGYLKTVRFAQW